jgi:hypothetical protein
MWKRAIFIGIAGAAVFVLNGCMMGMHGDMSGGHGGHQAELGTALVKEVVQDSVKMTAEIPPLWTGREAAFTVKVEDLSSGRPVSGASVDVTVQSKDHAGMLKSVEGSAREGAEKGVYVFRQTFVERGWYEIVFTVKNTPGPGGGPAPLIVRKEVLQAPDSDATGHDGRQSTALYIIGGAAMVVMMLVMML